MGRVTADISLSVDGYSTGARQREEAPFGDGWDDSIHAWMFDHGDDNRAEVDGILAASAYVMGRNMFGPVRGPWTGDWRGWWGPEPPYHGPVYVLTHHERDPIEMEGGTTFHFVTSGPAEALRLAREAVGDADVSIAGGASTVNQFIRAGLLDVLRMHVAPLTLGLTDHPEIVRLFDGCEPLRLQPAGVRQTPHVTHITFEFS